MEDLGKNIVEIQLDELLPTAMKKKEEGFRVGQICSVYVNDKYELSYSFAKEYELVTYRVIVDKETEVPSITPVFGMAFLYENEMKELFGVKMQCINLDYNNKLYRIDVETPFLTKKEEK